MIHPPTTEDFCNQTCRGYVIERSSQKFGAHMSLSCSCRFRLAHLVGSISLHDAKKLLLLYKCWMVGSACKVAATKSYTRFGSIGAQI